MDRGLIAVRYAKALLESAIHFKKEDTVYAEMQTLAVNYLQVPQLRFTIDNPTLDNDKKLSLLKTACGGEVTDLTVRFLELVFQEGQRVGLAVYGYGLYHPLPQAQEHHPWETYHRRACIGTDRG